MEIPYSIYMIKFHPFHEFDFSFFKFSQGKKKKKKIPGYILARRLLISNPKEKKKKNSGSVASSLDCCFMEFPNTLT